MVRTFTLWHQDNSIVISLFKTKMSLSRLTHKEKLLANLLYFIIPHVLLLL